MADEIKDAIKANATAGIASTTVGDRSTTAIDVTKQIEADKYLESKTVAANPFRAIRSVRVVPPSALGD